MPTVNNSATDVAATKATATFTAQSVTQPGVNASTVWQRLAMALRAEIYTATRGSLPWVLVTLPTITVVLRLLVAKLFGGTAEQLDSNNGYGHLVDALLTGLVLLYLLFIGYSAYSFAADRDSGSLRHWVIRFTSRVQLVVAKYCVACGFAVLATLLLMVVAWGLAVLLWDLGPVVEDGFELISEAEIRREIVLGLQLALIPLPAAIALGLLISVAASSATQAVALALGLSLLVDLFKNALGETAHYLFAYFHPSLADQSYLSDVAKIVRGFSDVLIDDRLLQLNLWLPLPQAVVMLVLALVWITRRRL